MRSNQIHKALAQGMNRFEVCQLVSKGVKATHKTGSRFEDSINDVLQYLGTHEYHQGQHSPRHSPGQRKEPQAGRVSASDRSSGAVRERLLRPGTPVQNPTRRKRGTADLPSLFCLILVPVPRG